MLKRTVQLFFILIGGTLGFIFIPELILFLSVDPVPLWIINPYIGALVGAIVLFLTTFWLADFIVDFLKVLEEQIVNAPVTDVIFGTLGLIVGLIVAYLIGIPLSAINIAVVSTVLPIFVTILLGYFGFRIGFKKRDELINLVALTRNLGKKKE